MLQASMPTAYINAIGTAVPSHDVHDKFVQYAPQLLTDERLRKLFRRMADRCQIEHRYSFFAPDPDPEGFVSLSSGDSSKDPSPVASYLSQ